MRAHELFEQPLNELTSRIDPHMDHTLWISSEGQIWSMKDQSIHSVPDNEEAENYMRDYDINSFEQPAVTHGTWMAYNWEKLFHEPFDKNRHDPYEDPIDKGWLRIRNHGRQFNINSTQAAARKLFKVWWPAVANKMKVEDAVTVFVDEISNGERSSLMFKMPQDKAKLIDWGRG